MRKLMTQKYQLACEFDITEDHEILIITKHKAYKPEDKSSYVREERVTLSIQQLQELQAVLWAMGAIHA